MSRATCLAVLCALAAYAHASPRTDPTMGRSVFSGATVPNPTSVDVNPAAIGIGIRDELYIAALAAIDRISIDKRDLDVDTGTLSPGAHETDNMLSPGANVAYIWHTGSDGRITIGVLARTSPAERFIEGKDSLRYHTLGGEFRTYSGSLAASVKFSSRFFFGLSLAAQQSFLKLRYARDTALEAGRDPARGIDSDCGGSPCGVENPEAAERYDVDVKSDLFSASNVVALNIGFVTQIVREVWLGVSYHAPPGLSVQNQLRGTVQVTRAPRDGGDLVDGGSTVYLSQPPSFDGELRARLPYQLDLHVGARLEYLSRLATYDVRTYGSTLPAAGIPEWMPRPRGFSNSFALWGGIEQVETEFFEPAPVRFGGRLGFETSSLDDERTSPITIAPTSFTLDAGAEVRLGDDVIIQATYGLQYFPSVNVTQSAFDPRDRLACSDSGYDYTTPACAAVRAGYAIPSAAGDYQRMEHAIRVAVRVQR